MILDSDMAQLEWRTAAELSRDRVMIDEILNGVDAHGMNCTDLMELPLTKENRQNAKITSFRLLYGGSAYAFYMDPKMPNFSLKKWEQIVKNFYQKYYGLAQQQDRWMDSVVSTGKIILPSGRTLRPQKVEKNGVWDYSRPSVVNYPVQAYATGDLMPLAMGVIDMRLRKIGAYEKGNLFINQVHDSIIFDTINKNWAVWIGHVAVHTFRQLPQIVLLLGWQDDWKVPMDGDISISDHSWGEAEGSPIEDNLMARLRRTFSLTADEKDEILKMWGEEGI
jgi:DNA polymerase I-like protein with 3'-5' exonuclease and polymerase domains